MSKATKRGSSRKTPAKTRAKKRQPPPDKPAAPAEPAGMLTAPPQSAPMQRDYLRSLIGKERGAIAPGSKAPTDGNYAIRLLTFAVGKPGL